MKTKIFTLFLTIVAGIETLFATNYTGSCGENLVWMLNTNDSVLSIYGSGVMTNYYSSSYVPWYSYKDYIKKIEISNGVTSIGNWAFSDCENLISVTIPNSITSIKNAAFSLCNSMRAVYIDDLYAWCTIDFAPVSNPLAYAHNLYLNGTLITSLAVPEGISSIRNYAFKNCESITSVIIPNTVTSIRDEAFYGCRNLASIEFSENITDIGEMAFHSCTSLTSIELPENLTSIKYRTFASCNNLESVIIPNNVQAIKSRAFCECEKLSYICIGNSVNIINDQAFWNVDKCTYKVLATTPPEIELPNTNNRGGSVLLVPKESITLYSSAEWWKDFGVIRAIGDTDSVPQIEPSIFRLSINDYICTISDTINAFLPDTTLELSNISITAADTITTIEISQIQEIHNGWSFDVKLTNAIGRKTYKVNVHKTSAMTYVRATLNNSDKTSVEVSGNGELYNISSASAYHQTSEVETYQGLTGYKLSWDKTHVGITFPSSTLQKGDIVNLYITRDSYVGDGKLRIYSDEGNTILATFPRYESAGIYQIILGEDADTLNSIYLYRTKGKDGDQNQHVAYMEIVRPTPYYTVTGTCDNTLGYITGTGYYPVLSSKDVYAQVEAIPLSGYHFSTWNDGSIENPRTLVLTKDTTLIAEFAQNIEVDKYTIEVYSADPEAGIVSNGGTYDAFSEVTIMAAACKEGYIFDKWSDGVELAGRKVTLTSDTVLIAYFVSVDEGCIEVGVNDVSLGEADILIQATPYESAQFVQWSDGDTNNPRIVTDFAPTTYIAIFSSTTTDIQEVQSSNNSAEKILRHDNILILRGDHIFTIQGQKVK